MVFTTSTGSAENGLQGSYPLLRRHNYLGHGKMMFRKIDAIVALLAIGLGPMMMKMVASTPSHPLDSLEAEEYKAVTQILQDAKRLTNITRFAQVSLVPPTKSIVKAWTKGDPIPRRAVAYLKDGAKTYKTIIDLVAKSVVSFDGSEGEPMFL
jgi:Cu2+-containing amine oxidase